MSMPESEAPREQVELFDLPPSPPLRRRDEPLRLMRLRQDHAVLLLMVGLVGCSVVFAWGMERGKRVARRERPLLAAPTATRQASVATREAGSPPTREAQTATAVAEAPADVKPTATSAFVVQVVTYRRHELADQELQRLQRQGEPAFIRKKQDKTVLYVGPFSTKEHASAKLTSLRKRYRDCFIRSL